jgi:hypothetical protein
MTASSTTIRSVDHRPDLNEVPAIAPAGVIDFFEARHRLLTDSERIAQENGIDGQVQTMPRGRSVGLADGFEEGLYWFIAAAVLAYLALAIFGF